MKEIRQNKVRLLHDIIYKIYSITERQELQKAILNFITLLVPCSKASFYLGGAKEGEFMGSPVGYNISEEILQLYIDSYMEVDYAKEIFTNPKTIVYRETDMFADEVREQSNYYQSLYVPEKIHYVVQINLYSKTTFLGIIALYRSKKEEDFSDEDIFFLDILKDHLALKLSFYLEEKDEKVVQFDEAHYKSYKLTIRETEIVKLLFKGYSDEEISDTLCISLYTTKKHITNIYAKMGIHRKWELFKQV